MSSPNRPASIPRHHPEDCVRWIRASLIWHWWRLPAYLADGPLRISSRAAGLPGCRVPGDLRSAGRSSWGRTTAEQTQQGRLAAASPDATVLRAAAARRPAAAGGSRQGASGSSHPVSFCAAAPRPGPFAPWLSAWPVARSDGGDPRSANWAGVTAPGRCAVLHAGVACRGLKPPAVCAPPGLAPCHSELWRVAQPSIARGAALSQGPPAMASFSFLIIVRPVGWFSWVLLRYYPKLLGDEPVSSGAGLPLPYCRGEEAAALTADARAVATSRREHHILSQSHLDPRLAGLAKRAAHLAQPARPLEQWRPNSDDGYLVQRSHSAQTAVWQAWGAR